MSNEPALAPLSYLDAFPRRLFLAGTALPIYDSLGFVQRIASDEIIPARHLTDGLATLVFAPPWTGKTFVAKQLYNALKSSPESPFGDYCQITSFETPLRNTEAPPLWWESWRSSASQACWIIDAVDEDERERERRVYRILDLVDQLSSDQRHRLRLLFFARENEIPEPFETRLTEIFGQWSTRGDNSPRKVRLAGLDRESARDLLGADDFDRVCQIIEDNKLQAVASLPAALEFLRGYNSSRHLTKADVWKGVLMNLLRDRRDRLLPSAEIEDEFEAVAWLAAALSFSGERELEDSRVASAQPMLEELVPKQHPQYQILRSAARLAFKTAVFERSENGFRFAQDHIREWFTAFALKDLQLIRIRPLFFSRSGGPNARYQGVMGILTQITGSSELRDWIIESHGGVAPPSDAGPWSIEDATRALDTLQMLARGSAWGLSLWRDKEQLNHFAVSGIGEELAKRLNSPLAVNEERLLLEIGQVVRAYQISESALRLAKDRDKDDHVRNLAVHLVGQLGSDAEVRSLEEWTRSTSMETLQDTSVLTASAANFYRRDIWDFTTAARLALQVAEKDRWDYTLQAALSEDMMPDRARHVLHLVASWPSSSDKASLHSSYLVKRAVAVLTSESEPNDLDVRALAALLLEEEALVESTHQNRELREFFSRNVAARRTLFLAGLEQDPTGRGHSSWLWRHRLHSEDTEWLLTEIEARKGTPSWLFESLYWIALPQRVSRSLRKRVHETIRQHDEMLLAQLDRQRRSLEQRRRRWQSADQGERRHLELPDLVKEALEAPDLTLHRRMLRISHACFSKPTFRPTNVVGSWEELPHELRIQAIDTCREALEKSLPTPIPNTQSFPSSILWEASCFSHMAAKEFGYPLRRKVIKKWLPALLRTHDPYWEVTLRRCIDVAPNLSENLIMEAIAREISFEPGTVYTLQQLPLDLWSEHIALRLEKEFIRSESTHNSTRTYLLDRLNRVYPERARSIAEEWAEYESESQRELSYAGVDVLLASYPSEGWKFLARLLEQEDAASVFSRMRSLQPHHYGPQADLQSWPADLLEQLTNKLFLAFPPGSDPVREVGVAYSLGEEDDLRSVREYIPKILLQRNLPEDRIALERLTQNHARIKQWYSQELADKGAEGFLEQISRRTVTLSGSEEYVPVEQVIKVLLDSRYRLLRSAADLQAVVLEHLQAIKDDAKRHLSMLYMPRPEKAEGKRSRLYEDALQAYIECRLRDRLGSGVLERQPKIIFLNREPLAVRDTRNDLKVQTQAIDATEISLVIEIKWSDNKDVSTSLVTQLGIQYLKENKLTHGIYLVGWNGSPAPWKRTALGKPPKPRLSHAAWQKSLDEQAHLFLEENPEMQITPVVIDLTWDPPGNQTSK